MELTQRELDLMLLGVRRLGRFFLEISTESEVLVSDSSRMEAANSYAECIALENRISRERVPGKWSSGNNVPGYLPDTDEPNDTGPSWAEAWLNLCVYLEEIDTLGGDTYEQAKADAIKAAKDMRPGDEFGVIIAGRNYWLERR